MELISEKEINTPEKLDIVGKLGYVIKRLKENKSYVYGVGTPLHILNEVFEELSKTKSNIKPKPYFGYSEKDYTFIKCGKKTTFKIFYDDISHIKSDGDYCWIQTISDRHHLHCTLRNILERLPKDRFIQCHRSYIINIGRVDHFNKNLIFIGNQDIPIGNRYRNGFIKKVESLS